MKNKKWEIEYNKLVEIRNKEGKPITYEDMEPITKLRHKAMLAENRRVEKIQRDKEDKEISVYPARENFIREIIWNMEDDIDSLVYSASSEGIYTIDNRDNLISYLRQIWDRAIKKE